MSPARLGFLARAILYGALGSWGDDALARLVLGDSEVPEVAREYMALIYTHFRSRVDAQPLLTDGQLEALAMPALLLVGARDALFDSGKTAARFQQLVKGADVRMLPEAGHALINVAGKMVPFLAEAIHDTGSGRQADCAPQNMGMVMS